MSSHQRRNRGHFALETLEGRVALSAVGGLAQGIPHHHRHGHAAEVHMMRRGHDDPAGHKAHDDRGGASAAAHRPDDPAGHNAHDDRGGAQSATSGSDDSPGHDANDANDDHGGRGADDGPAHDAGDDHGGHGSDDGSGHK